MDPETMQLIPGGVAAHTVSRTLKYAIIAMEAEHTTVCHLLQHQCIKNLSAILTAAGSSLEKVVKVNVFIADMADFAKVSSRSCQGGHVSISS
jgi:hypothetical protein